LNWLVVEIDGNDVKTEQEFHKQLAAKLDFGEFYGHNLDALWDRLSTDVEHPVTLVWKNSIQSKRAMGSTFTKIIQILERVQEHDRQCGWVERFQFRLE
jgi:ribonuclease inhibitor